MCLFIVQSVNVQLLPHIQAPSLPALLLNVPFLGNFMSAIVDMPWLLEPACVEAGSSFLSLQCPNTMYLRLDTSPLPTCLTHCVTCDHWLLVTLTKVSIMPRYNDYKSKSYL